MNPTFVILKAADKPSQTEFNLASYLVSGQTISAVAIAVLGPVTSPVLTASATYIGTAVTVLCSGGQATITYNVRLTVTTATPTETKLFTLATSVRDSEYVSFQTKNPLAFKRLIDEIDVGESAVGSGTFMLKSGTNLSAARVLWSLMDSEGVVYSKGNAYDYVVTNTSLAARLVAYALVNVPSDTPPTSAEHSFMVRWELEGIAAEPIYSFEGVRLLGATTTPQGVGDVIEMRGDPATVSITLPELFESVALEIYNRNTKIAGPTNVPLLERTNDGHYYAVTVDTSGMPASIEAYSTIWSYRNGNSTGEIGTNREVGRLFIVSPTMLAAVEDVRSMVMKARATLLGFPDVLFTTHTILGWLRRGRDYFNGAGGFITTFNMSAASGAIREFWLGYTEVAMLQAHALAEAEKAFDFQGQAISLSRDVTQAYQSAADTLYQRLNENVRMLKQSLARKGVQGGDGDVENIRTGQKAVVGIMLTPITRYPRFQGRNVINR